MKVKLKVEKNKLDPLKNFLLSRMSGKRKRPKTVNAKEEKGSILPTFYKQLLR